MRNKTYKIWLVVAAFQAFLMPGVLAVPGDVDGDNDVDIEDLMRVAEWWTLEGCDLDNHCNGADMTGPEDVRDGVVDFYDFAMLSAHWFEEGSVPGDVDGDGDVDIEDVTRVAEWWTIDFCDFFNDCEGADIAGPAGVRDGIVDFYDFAILSMHWLETSEVE